MPNLPTLIIAMPVFNEVEGIEDFIEEILLSFNDIDLCMIIVDDYSTDGCREKLITLSNRGEIITVICNDRNMGHGQSTIIGMRESLKIDSDFIMTVDGDGQFSGSGLRHFFNTFLKLDVDIFEGCRRRANEPWFRVVISWATRLIVKIKTGEMTLDANTPLRIYTPNSLNYLLDHINKETLIPNIHVSVISRKAKMKVGVSAIQFLPRRGLDARGTTWNQKQKWFPSKKLVLFCFLAFQEVLRLN